MEADGLEETVLANLRELNPVTATVRLTTNPIYAAESSGETKTKNKNPRNWQFWVLLKVRVGMEGPNKEHSVRVTLITDF